MQKIKPIMGSHSTVIYLDFVKKEVIEILCHSNFRVGKLTGQTTVEDRKQADYNFFTGLAVHISCN